MKVHLTSILAETNLEVAPKSLFSDLCLRICKSLGLNEAWYFGLCYHPTPTADLVWLDTSRKVLKKLPYATKNLNFKIKYYPEDVGNELIENITVQIFYMEIKRDILQGSIYCPADIAALLASYSLQVEYGNYNSVRYQKYLMANQNFLPYRVMRQYDVDVDTWTNTISGMWQKLAGMDPEDAMLEYLKLAQNLDMFGVTYFNILNKKKTKLLLGVSALGLAIYSRSNKLTPQLSFSWSEIRKLKFKGKKFTIKPMGKKIPNFLFYTMSKNKSKEILDLGNGNHKLYIRRRKADSPDVIVLKEKAKGVRTLREEHKLKLNREVTYKEDYLRREEEYHHQLKRLQEDLELTMKRIHLDVLAKLEETKVLQKQIDNARKAEEEYIIQHQKKEEAKIRQRARLEDESRGDQELESIFANDNMQLPEPVKVSEKLQSHLQSLQRKLEESLKEEEATQFDRIHRENATEGRDKYKTLSDIRGENIIKRIRMFYRM